MSSLEQAKVRVWIRDVIFILTFLAGLFMLWHNVDNRQALTELRLDSLAEETYRINHAGCLPSVDVRKDIVKIMTEIEYIKKGQDRALQQLDRIEQKSSSYLGATVAEDS